MIGSLNMKVTPEQNHLLSALDKHSKTRIYQNLELISMPTGKVIYESGDKMSHVYFPTNCIVSLI